VLRECDKLEPLVKRVHGTLSSDMTILLRCRAGALQKLNRFSQARAAAHECLRIDELVSGRGDDYAFGLHSLAGICRSEGDFDAGLKHFREARSCVSGDNLYLLGSVMNSEALLLVNLGRYQEALVVREKAMEICLRLYGSNHPNYATSLANSAHLYAKLKQTQRAFDLMTKAVAIYMKVFGPLHPRTQEAHNFLAEYQKALIDPALKNELAPTKNRMCNIDGCNTVEESMERCMACKAHYLCEKHTKLINEHVNVCPKFGDLLPDEKKLANIVKCRRCRKQTKLMKCSVCESVWYCGAQCQNEDWKRHKLFCGKK
jgi:tetratricopeptide (TPR) repeat protein